jgi:peptidyl-prolyl cis-trans isomerase SurA
MTLRFLRISAVSVLSTMLLATSALAQTHPAAPESPYGGVTIEDIVARVNDQIITRSDYDRALKELDDEARQHGATMQQISDGHKDLLRNLIDQQLWLSKGKELGITGETELINKLNDIRKQYNLSTLEDLEKAAQQQGVSYEDFKANIRNQIITQQVMRDEVGRRVSITPGEAQRYFDAHKQEYAQPESVRLSEILVSTGTPAASATTPGETQPDDPQKVAAAQAKADEIEAKLKAGGDFAQIAKTSSDGQTASNGGDLGQYRRGALNKVFEDATFSLKTGDVTAPIRTKQGFVIFKVVQHTAGGIPGYKDVQQDVEQAYYESKMMPAMRDYLTKMREDSYVEIKPGFEDTGASPNKRVVPISYSTYTPPAPKKKKKVERTRFRETTRTFRQKSPQAAQPEETAAAAPSSAQPATPAPAKATEQASMKPGKKEKIRYGQAPTKTLPAGPEVKTEDAGANSQVAANNEPANPLESNPAPEKKTRFSDRARAIKQAKSKGKKADPLTPVAPDAAEVADRQTQSSPLGLAGDTSTKKKKRSTTTSDKTRLSDKKKTGEDSNGTTSAPAEPTPIPAVPGAPAPTTTPPTSPTPQQ